MIQATITGWGKCVPPAVLSNDDLAGFLDTDDEWIRSRTGIQQRHISHVGTAQLAAVAAHRALAAAGIDANEIDLLILATASPDTLVPNTAAAVQQSIGALKAGVFDLNAACSGFLYGVGLASSLIKSGNHKRILLAGAERLTWYMDWSKRDTAVLFGDGAGAVVIEAGEGDAGILSYTLGNDPSGQEILKITGFGTSMERFGEGPLNMHLQFNGREIFKRAIAGMAATSTKSLQQAGLNLEDIDLVVPHQANIRIIEGLLHKMGLPKEKAYVNIEKYGNTSAATIPIALCDALEDGSIQPGATLLSCAFGAGLSSAAAVMKWGERVMPIAESSARLPPCEKSGLQLIEDAVRHCFSRV